MSDTNKYISSKNILSKVYRDLNLKTEDRFYDMLEWTFEALEGIGVPMYKIPKACEITIEDYKHTLPFDFESDIQVEYAGRPLLPHSGVFGVENTFSEIHAPEDIPEGVDNGLASYNNTRRGDYYEIVPGYIKTSFRSGVINLAYLALPVDEDNFPLVPDEFNCREAIFWYIAYKLILGGMNISNVKMADAYMFWEKYCKQARSYANMPTLAQLEKLKIQHLSLVPNTNAYNTFFENLNQYPKL